MLFQFASLQYMKIFSIIFFSYSKLIQMWSSRKTYTPQSFPHGLPARFDWPAWFLHLWWDLDDELILHCLTTHCNQTWLFLVIDVECLLNFDDTIYKISPMLPGLWGFTRLNGLPWSNYVWEPSLVLWMLFRIAT